MGNENVECKADKASEHLTCKGGEGVDPWHMELGSIQDNQIQATQHDKPLDKAKANDGAIVAQNVSSLKNALDSGDIGSVNELFNKIAPVIEPSQDKDEFHQSRGVKNAEHTIDEMNKALKPFGIHLDYRPTGVFADDSSPSLIVSREQEMPGGAIKHTEVTLQAGTDAATAKQGGAETFLIENGMKQGTGKDGAIEHPNAQAAFATIMEPYRGK
jgi:hypothetical protein